MSTPRDGGPAFPSLMSFGKEYEPKFDGMSLRDWFAGQANGFDLAIPSEMPAGKTWEEVIAGARYRYADAMLQAREAR